MWNIVRNLKYQPSAHGDAVSQPTTATKQKKNGTTTTTILYLIDIK